MSLNRMILCSNLKNDFCKIVTKSQVVTKLNVTKSRLHCSALLLRLVQFSPHQSLFVDCCNFVLSLGVVVL